MGSALQGKLEAEYANNIKNIYQQDLKEKRNSTKLGKTQLQKRLWDKTNEENENDAIYDIQEQIANDDAAEFEQDPLLYDFLQKSFVKGRIADV